MDDTDIHGVLIEHGLERPHASNITSRVFSAEERVAMRQRMAVEPLVTMTSFGIEGKASDKGS